MNFRLLGPLEVDDDGGAALAIGTGRQRALLGLLVLRANELVASDRLVEELWGASPPPTAHKMLHNQVSALRQALGRNGRLETLGSAYRLNVAPGERDVDRFEELVARGRALTGADPGLAAQTLHEALGMWRGSPLSDLAYESFAQAEIARLEERRWAAFEAWTDAELAGGRHADLVGELEAAVKHQPLRERLHGQLMLALYRCGRQAEALEAYRRARATLVEEIGVEPGAELRALHEAILAQDPALASPTPAAAGSPVLAGRDDELAELMALLDTGGLALVSGPRGIGKTRLAEELARAAARRGKAVHTTPPAAADAGVLILDDAGSDVLDRAVGLSRSMPVVVLHERPLPDDLPARRIVLGPLAPDAVAEIARLYDGSLPADALTRASGGVPLAAHRLAAEWARERAAAAVGTSAGRATSERGELRSAEADLSGDLLRLRALDERARRYGGGEAPAAAVCPFLGLATFDAAHAEYFFGRERLVAELVARLVGAPLLAVIGPSGSGKSSALRAGLLPALADGVLPGSDHWRQALMRPGPRPRTELERTLIDAPAVLAIDQFEETFTVCRDDRERAAFLDAIAELADDRDRPLQIVVAMRADFYGHCAANDRLARLVGANQVLVGPMRRGELRRAIEEPARRVGLHVEPSLTDALIADTLDQPGGLPLLSAALLEQWRERDGRTLERATYERTGGVRGAVGRLAERTYTTLGEPERRAARSLLLRLADAGEHGASFVRRRMPLDELARDDHTAAALTALVDSRLVTVQDDALEVAHEALLREWPRLRSWLEEDADGRRLHQRLIGAARDWHAAGRDSGELYRGARLASAHDWVSGHDTELNEREREFLAASRAEAEDEAQHERRTNRRLRALLAGLAVLLVVALAAGVVALNQRGEARDAALAADAQRLGVEARNLERLDRALLSARAAVALDETPDTLSNLLSVLQRSPATLGAVDHDWGIYGAAISPDGELMAIGDDIGNVVVYDAATRQPVGPPYAIEGIVQNVRFSPDGNTLAVSYFEPGVAEISAVFDLIDPRTRERRLRLRLPPLDGPVNFVYADVHFLRDGRDLLVVPVHGSSPNGPAAPVYRIDGETGAITDRLQVGAHSPYLYASETAAGHVFLTSVRDGTTWELDPEPLRVVRSWPVADRVGAVSPDGRLFALGSAAGRLRLLDLDSGRIRPFRGAHDGGVVRIRFAADGRTLVTTGAGGQVIAWDVERRMIARRFTGHSRVVDGLDITSDGRTLITGSLDMRAIVWDLAGDRGLDRRFAVGRPFRLQFGTRGIAASPDGRTLAITHGDGAVDLLDAASLRRRGALRALDAAAVSVDFSPDGRLLAVTGAGGRITLWDARTLAPAGELEGLEADSYALAFSPDGRLLAATEPDPTGPLLHGPLRIWDVRSRRLTAFRGRNALGGIAFSPDGELIAAAVGRQGTEVREVGTGRLVQRLATGDSPYALAFSPDGELLFVGQYDGRGQLISTEDWRPVDRRLEGHTARITFAEFAADGRTLVTAAADGTARLWDVETQKPLGSPLALAPGTFASVALSPDGARAFAVSTRGEGIAFALSREAWKRHACRVAGRDLTRAEWEDALPGRPYEAVCR